MLNMVVIFGGGEVDRSEREDEGTVRWFAQRMRYLRPVMMLVG